MENLAFDGELTQLVYREGIIHELHLRGYDGREFVITIEKAEDLAPIGERFSGPYVPYLQRQRPLVTIRRSYS